MFILYKMNQRDHLSHDLSLTDRVTWVLGEERIQSNQQQWLGVTEPLFKRFSAVRPNKRVWILLGR